MKKCEECGKTLGFLEGYRHPTLGKNHLLCNPCFDQVSESVEKWRNVVLSYANFFNNNTSKRNLHLKTKNKFTYLIEANKTATNTRADESCIITGMKNLI
jgi:hypothetical protein